MIGIEQKGRDDPQSTGSYLGRIDYESRRAGRWRPVLEERRLQEIDDFGVPLPTDRGFLAGFKRRSKYRVRSSEPTGPINTFCNMSGNSKPAVSGDSRSLLSSESAKSTIDSLRCCGGSVGTHGPLLALGQSDSRACFKPAANVAPPRLPPDTPLIEKR